MKQSMDSDRARADALHEFAQSLSTQSVMATFLDLPDHGQRLLELAAEVERAAARLAVDTPERARRSRWYLDAIRKLMNCGRLPESHALIAEALADNPPAWMEQRLVVLWEREQAHAAPGRLPAPAPPVGQDPPRQRSLDENVTE
jgi:hypothetical protein